MRRILPMSRSLIASLAMVAISLFAVSCNQNMERMAKDYQSGVALVQTIEYYEMVLGNGNSLYFTGSDFDKQTGEFVGVFAELDSLVPDVMYGTGFFVSDDGMLATNKHVVEGNITEKEARQGLSKILYAIEDALEELKDEYLEYKMNMASLIVQNPDTVPGSLQGQKDAFEYFTQTLEEIEELASLFKHLDVSDIDLKYHNDVRIAYNNTFVNTMGDLKPCTIREKSDTDDLAIIQLNTKQTPEGRHIFKLTPRDMLQHYSFGEFLSHLIGADKNEELMMIGFNYGPGMPSDEGLVAQHPTGSISQYVAKSREVQYRIPALVGTSGSPVINRRGQLVAIQYAGSADESNQFNYGIKEKYLHKLINNLK